MEDVKEFLDGIENFYDGMEENAGMKNRKNVFPLIYFLPCLFTRKPIELLYFGRDVCTRLEVAISEVSGSSVFHIQAGAFR